MLLPTIKNKFMAFKNNYIFISLNIYSVEIF